MKREKLLSALQTHWKELIKEGQVTQFHEGQVLFYEGHMPYGLFILLKGNVTFTKDGSPSPDDHRWSSPKGVIIGMEPFLNQSPYCCTGTAQQDCRAIFISKTLLAPLMSS